MKKKKKSKKLTQKVKNYDKNPFVSKDELKELKEAYKKGKLKFDAKDIVEAIMKDLGKGITG